MSRKKKGNVLAFPKNEVDSGNSILEPNLATIRRFFNFFSSDPEELFCVAYFGSDSGDVIPGCGTIFQTAGKIIGEIHRSTKMEVHMLLNKSDGLGRKRENITGVRAFVLDIDRYIESTEIKSLLLEYRPHMVVRSSRRESDDTGKYHLYWRADSRLSIARWEVYERGIAELLGGDSNSAQPTKLMRVPGIPRRQKDGMWYVPELLACEVGKEPIDPRWVFDKVLDAAGKAKRRERGERKRLYERVASSELTVGNWEGAAEIASRIKGGKRNESLYWIARELVVDGKVSELRELHELIGEVNLGISVDVGGPLERRELVQVVRSAWKRGVKRRREIDRKRVMKKEEGKKLLKDTEYDMSKSRVNGHGQGNGHGNGSAPTEIIESEDVYRDIAISGSHDGEDDGSDTDGKGVERAVRKKLVRLAVAEKAKTDMSEPVRMDCIELLSDEYRRAPYSQRAIGERIVVHFKGELCMVDDRGLLAFNEVRRVWELQELRAAGVLYDQMLAQVLYNVLYSREFKDAHGYNRKGEFDEEKLERVREKIRSVGACQKYLFHVFNSTKFIQKSRGDFDSGEDSVLTASGLVNLASGEVREAQSTDYLLKRTGVKYDAQATCPEWEKFIGEIFSRNSDPESSIKFLQELFGYSLSGQNTFQYVFCHLGEGANGKSTVLGALRKLVGEYGTVLGPDALSRKSFDKFERLAVKLMHMRCAIIDDVQVSSGWDEAFVKNLTGRELEARNLYREVVVMRNRAKIHVCLNQMPEPETNSKGFFRRIKILNYNNTFDQNSKKSIEIEEMIERELSGIFNWAIKGYRRLCRQENFTTLEESLQEEREYRESTVLTDEALREIFEVSDTPETTERLMFQVERIAREKGVVSHFGNTVALGRKLRKLFPGTETQVKKQKRGFFLKLTPEYESDENSIL